MPRYSNTAETPIQKNSMTQKLTDAMLLSAGFGTRLKPLTLKKPKPLIEYTGKPMIEHVINKLISSGITKIVINTHYLSEQIEDYFNMYNFNAEIILVHEKQILGTGGAIKNAKRYLTASHFLIHNADVISDIDIGKMFSQHIQSGAFATLAVNQRETSRPLLFDSNNNIAGRIIDSKVFTNGKNQHELSQKAFCGIHIVSSEIFEFMPSENKFDIIDLYLKRSKFKNITYYDISENYWKDLGKIEDFK